MTNLDTFFGKESVNIGTDEPFPQKFTNPLELGYRVNMPNNLTSKPT